MDLVKVFSDFSRMEKSCLPDLDSAVSDLSACSLVGFWASLSWLVLVHCERKTLLAGWFGLVETNKQTDCISLIFHHKSLWRFL